MDRQSIEKQEEKHVVLDPVLPTIPTLPQKLARWGVELRGIHPVPVAERTDRQYNKIFFIWLSANVNILSFSAGTLAPVFGLGLRDACLVILFFNLLCCAFPAYLTTWGPKLGLRQMVQARYSFGTQSQVFWRYSPVHHDLIAMCGFCILNCILGGQTLSSVADGHLTWTVGIVITAIVALLVSFFGYKILNWYERIAWIPVLVVFVIALGVGGKHLSSPPASPATASAVLTFAATLAGFVITYSPLSSDFTSYFWPGVPSLKIFIYSYLGFLLPIVTLQCLGAAVAIAATNVPAWERSYADGNVGGLLAAMLQPTGNFGKFLTVLLALSVIGNIAATFYSFCLNVQVFVPSLVIVPRYIFSLVVTAIVIPIAIVGSHRFYSTLSNFLGLIGYWASAFVAIILTEQLIIRHNDFTRYNVDDWNRPSRLPWGIAALVSGLIAFGVAVLCMNQAWFVGPVAKTTGDIGFEIAFVVAIVLYSPLRAIEMQLMQMVLPSHRM